MVKKIEKKSLSEQAYEKLEEIIVTGVIKPGEIVSETQLSDYVKIGRMPVREAIRKLQLTHLIDILARKGIMVSIFTTEDLFAQLEIREALEKIVITRAAKLATKEEREYLEELAEEYEMATEKEDAIEALRVDYRYNDFVANCARNRFAKEALLLLHPLSRRQYYLNYNVDKELTKKVNYAHINLMRMIARGNIEKALEQNDILLELTQKINTIRLNNIINR